MKIYQEKIVVETKKVNEFINVTADVRKVADGSKIKNGIVFANSLHNTAALILQEADPTIFKDTIDLFERILPLKGKYHHDYEGNENATAHQKENLLGNSVSIPLKDGKLVFGSWQSVFLVEFFEPRRREIIVIVMGD